MLVSVSGGRAGLMFCFTVEHDVAEELSRAGLGDDPANVVQERVVSRLRAVYREIVVEEVQRAAEPTASERPAAGKPAAPHAVRPDDAITRPRADDELEPASFGLLPRPVSGSGDHGRLGSDAGQYVGGRPAADVMAATGRGGWFREEVGRLSDGAGVAASGETPASDATSGGLPADSRTVDALTDPSRFTPYGAGRRGAARGAVPALVGAHVRDEERVYVRSEPGGEVRRVAFMVRSQVPQARGNSPEVEVRVRLAIRRPFGVREPWRTQLREGVTAAVAQHLVPSAGVDFPGGGRLRVTVEHVAETGHPHLTVEVAGAGLGVTRLKWAFDAEPRALAEAVARQLGLDQAGDFGPEGRLLLERKHLRLLKALAFPVEDLRDRQGWVSTLGDPATDAGYLSGSMLPASLARYGVRPEFTVPLDPALHARNSDGTLAAPAQETRLRYHQRELAERLNDFGRARVTVDPGISDDMLRNLLGRQAISQKWPELVTYLGRRDRDVPGHGSVPAYTGSRTDQNFPLRDYQTRQIHPMVSLQYDPGLLPSADPRIAAITRALKLVLGAGYQLNQPLRIIVPKYGQAVTVTLENGRIELQRGEAAPAAEYFPPGDIAVGGEPMRALDDESLRMAAFGNPHKASFHGVAERVSDLLAALIVQEITHHLIFAESPEKALDTLAKLHPEVLDRVRRVVSVYGTENLGEAVAEIMTKQILGFPLEEWEEEMLQALGAPRPGPPTREHLNPHLSPEDVGVVADIVVRQLGRWVDQAEIMAKLGRLTAAERRLDLRLVSEAVVRLFEGGSPQEMKFSPVGPSTVRGGALLDVDRAEQDLARVLDDESDGRDCAVRLERAAKLWYPRSLVPRDDLALPGGAPESRLAAAVGGQWRPVGGSLLPVMERVRQLGRGATAFLLASPPDLAGLYGPVNTRHAYALRNLGGKLYWVETQGPPEQRFREVDGRPSQVPAPLVGMRVIVVEPNGRAVPDPLGDVTPAPGQHDALLAPASAHWYGASRELAGLSPARAGHPVAPGETSAGQVTEVRSMPVAPGPGEMDRDGWMDRAGETQEMVPSARDLMIARALLWGDVDQYRQEMRSNLAKIDGLLRRGGDGGLPGRLAEALAREARGLEEDEQVLERMSERLGSVLGRLREPQVAAMVLVERHGRLIEPGELQAARELLTTRPWAKGYGHRNPDDLLRQVHEHLRSGMRLITNYSSYGLEGVLSSGEGRFRNAWEADHWPMEGIHEVRADVEHAMGYAASTGPLIPDGQGEWYQRYPEPGSDDARVLPHYAALTSRLLPEGTPLYGNVVVVWRPEVRARATFAPRDSIQANGWEWVTGPDNLYPLLTRGVDETVRLAFAEATGFEADQQALEVMRNPPAGTARLKYIEAQVHGDLSLADVDRILLWYGPPAEGSGAGKQRFQTHADMQGLQARILEYARRNSLSLGVELRRLGDREPIADPSSAGGPGTADPSFDLVLEAAAASGPALPKQTVRVRVEPADTPVALVARIVGAFPDLRDATLTVKAPSDISRALLPALIRALGEAANSRQLRVKFHLGELESMNICGSPCVA
jgi:hypothetical protein